MEVPLWMQSRRHSKSVFWEGDYLSPFSSLRILLLLNNGWRISTSPPSFPPCTVLCLFLKCLVRVGGQSIKWSATLVLEEMFYTNFHDGFIVKHSKSTSVDRIPIALEWIQGKDKYFIGSLNLQGLYLTLSLNQNLDGSKFLTNFEYLTTRSNDVTILLIAR